MTESKEVKHETNDSSYGKLDHIAVALSPIAKGEVKMSIWGHTAEGVAVPIYTLTSGQSRFA